MSSQSRTHPLSNKNTDKDFLELKHLEFFFLVQQENVTLLVFLLSIFQLFHFICFCYIQLYVTFYLYFSYSIYHVLFFIISTLLIALLGGVHTFFSLSTKQCEDKVCISDILNILHVLYIRDSSLLMKRRKRGF